MNALKTGNTPIFSTWSAAAHRLECVGTCRWRIFLYDDNVFTADGIQMVDDASRVKAGVDVESYSALGEGGTTLKMLLSRRKEIPTSQGMINVLTLGAYYTCPVRVSSKKGFTPSAHTTGFLAGRGVKPQAFLYKAHRILYTAALLFTIQ